MDLKRLSNPYEFYFFIFYYFERENSILKPNTVITDILVEEAMKSCNHNLAGIKGKEYF